MNIEINVEGGYRGDDWIATTISARDLDGQQYEITLDTDGTYCVESKLLGDEEALFKGGLDFATAWAGLASAFGIVAQ